MADFEELLKKSIGGINTPFEAAERDLSEVVGEVAKALRSVANPNLDLRLAIKRDDESGRTYALSLTGKGVFVSSEVTYFFNPTRGYPIAEGNWGEYEQIQMMNSFSDRAELVKFFSHMLQDRDSALMTKVAFILRKIARSKP